MLRVGFLALLFLVGCGRAATVSTSPPAEGTESAAAPAAAQLPEAPPPSSAPSGALPCDPGDEVTDLAVGPYMACAVVSGRLACWGSRDRIPKPLRAVDGPADLVRVALNEKRAFGIDRSGGLHRWEPDNPFGESVQIATGIADVFAGIADGSTDPLCVLTTAGEAQCHPQVRDSELGEPWWTVPDAREVWIGPRHFCVRTEAELACRPIRGFTGDRDVTLNAEGATGFLWDYESACVLRPDGPDCANGFDPSEQLGGTHPSWAMTGWKDNRWGTCAQVGDVLQCRMGEDWTRTTAFEGKPTTVGMGKNFACARCGSAVSCWGEVFPLSLAGEEFRGLQPIEGLIGVTELYGGRSRLGEAMCARTEQGVHCWGPAARGVRDPSEPDEGLRPEDLAEEGLCALADGVVSCDGWQVPVSQVRELAQDSDVRCARTATEVVCFGGREELARFRVRARDIAVDGRTVCAATEAGTLECGVLGGDYATLQELLWERGEGLHRVGELSGVTHVELSLSSLCVAHEGRVSCGGSRWGNRLHDGGLFAAEPIRIPLADAFR